MRSKKSLVKFTFLTPSLLGISVFFVIPYADVIKRSFQTAVTGKWVGIDNYKRVFENEAFQLAAFNTIKFAVICLPLLILLGLLFALLVTSVPKMKGIQSFYLLPMAIPSATVVLVWKLTFDKLGFLNLFLADIAGILGRSSIVQQDYMNSSAAFAVLVFSYIWKNLGYTMILWVVALLSISLEITEAAKMDGANRSQVFFQIKLPQLLPTLYTISVLSFLNSFKVFREAYLVAGAYPDDSIYMLQHLFNNWFSNLEVDKMAAGAVIMGSVIMIGIFLLQKLWDEKGDSK